MMVGGAFSESIYRIRILPEFNPHQFASPHRDYTVSLPSQSKSATASPSLLIGKEAITHTQRDKRKEKLKEKEKGAESTKIQ
ncbi:hypothetical protein MtrunA17_Chr6g0483301 [Medicago truncatula]|uniref:Uncharacterized protein n=1 Tax=Medicago truncatula TaxID=3880 RepID=A0A396HP98_MEDTR|nr:hypothetical protein MtrunA17_Chr6g0483301 [Medicago truncatula]